ncbi:MAG: phosphatase PAP2 family protein [Halobacteriaceae archaeon]
MRGVGVLEVVVETVPAWATPVLVAVTTLGDPEVLLVVVTLVYWAGPRVGASTRRDAIRLFAVTITALAVVAAAKQWFALPRPSTGFVEYDASGFGFPSGHATATTAVYGAGVLLTRWGTRRQRVTVAAGMMGAVGVTRIALGVHYLVDVLAGIVTGGVVAALVIAATRRRELPGFWLAVTAGLGAAFVTGLDPTARMTGDAALAIGGTVGAATAWTVIASRGRELATPSLPVALSGAVAAGLPLLWVGVTSPGPVVTAAVAALASVVAVGVPALRTSRGTDPVPID